MAVPGKWFPPSSVAQPRGPDDRRPCRDGRRPRGPCEACDLVRPSEPLDLSIFG